MAVVLKPARPLEPVEWPTGEEVRVRRPNLYAAEHWDTYVVPALSVEGKSGELRDGLVGFVALICPDKTEAQIREECSEDFLWLVAGYARDRLEAASQVLDLMSGKATGEVVDPAQPSPTGSSPAESPVLAAAPCGV